MPRPARDSDAEGVPHATRVTLARILRPRGRIGEVAAELFTDLPERLITMKEVFLARNSSDPSPLKMKVVRCWLHKGGAVFQFDGVDSINAAEKLRGLEVQVSFEQRVKLPAGKYFVSDLVGCEVFCKEDNLSPTLSANPAERVGHPQNNLSGSLGAALVPSKVEGPFTAVLREGWVHVGIVRDVMLETGTPLLIVDSEHGELLIPLAEDICRRIDVQTRRIEVVLPEGLLDLNAR